MTLLCDIQYFSEDSGALWTLGLDFRDGLQRSRVSSPNSVFSTVFSLTACSLLSNKANLLVVISNHTLRRSVCTWWHRDREREAEKWPWIWREQRKMLAVVMSSIWQQFNIISRNNKFTVVYKCSFSSPRKVSLLFPNCWKSKRCNLQSLLTTPPTHSKSTVCSAHAKLKYKYFYYGIHTVSKGIVPKTFW